MAIINWIVAHKVLILSVVIGIDTALAAIPQVQASSTFQLITSIIMKAKDLIIGK